MPNSGSQEYGVAQAQTMLPIISIAACSGGSSVGSRAQTTMSISTRCITAPGMSRHPESPWPARLYCREVFADCVMAATSYIPSTTIALSDGLPNTFSTRYRIICLTLPESYHVRSPQSFSPVASQHFHTSHSGRLRGGLLRCCGRCFLNLRTLHRRI